MRHYIWTKLDNSSGCIDFFVVVVLSMKLNVFIQKNQINQTCSLFGINICIVIFDHTFKPQDKGSYN